MNLRSLGLDVAKLKFNACLLRAAGKLRHKVFPNNLDGFAQLSDWLEKQRVKQVHACFERPSPVWCPESGSRAE
jgi:transposase